MNTKCNFSLKHYIDVLKYARKNYEIHPIRNFPKLKNHKKFILLRHDVDCSLDYALHMAKLESKNNFFSTYFILLHSSFYNAFSPSNFSKIKKISELGHEIGLHYDTSFFSTKQTKLLDQIKNEIFLLSSLLEKKVVSIAQHNPTINEQPKVKFPPNIINADELKTKMFYISDSVQNWRMQCMCNHVGQHDKIQILIHPIWWTKENSSRSSIYKKFKNKQIENQNNEFSKMKLSHQSYFRSFNKEK